MQGTHPELLEYSDDVNVQIDFYGRHSRFIYPVGVPSPRLGTLGRVPRWLGDIVLRGVGIDPDTFTGSTQSRVGCPVRGPGVHGVYEAHQRGPR